MSVSNRLLVALAVSTLGVVATSMVAGELTVGLAGVVVIAHVAIVTHLDVSPTTIRWWWVRILLGGAFLYGAATRSFVALLLFAGAVYLVERSTPPWAIRPRPYAYDG